MTSPPGRKLNVVLIDDQAREDSEVSRRLRTIGACNLFIVQGLRSALRELRRIEQAIREIGQIDIILCDIAMEKDATFDGGNANFEVKRDSILGAETFLAEPKFSVLGLEDAQDVKRPFGPILALPFTRFFRNGGVIMPISAFWSTPPLVGTKGEKRPLNGYVYAALALMWNDASADADFDLSHFGKRFSEYYSAAANEKTPDIISAYFTAVSQRRAQLLDYAYLLPDLAQSPLTDPDKSGRRAVRYGTFRIMDKQLATDYFDLKSLYSDIDNALANPDTFTGAPPPEEIVEEERSRYAASSFDWSPIYEFCKAFVELYWQASGDTDSDLNEVSDAMAMRYNVVAAKVGFDSPARISEYGDTPFAIRRYLLLFLQMLHWVGKNRNISNTDVVECLGLNLRGLPRFVQGSDAARNEDWQVWMRPFNEIAGDDKGWQEFNLFCTRKGARRNKWTSFDRELASRFWSELETTYSDLGEIPFGLAD
jgi:hypothetical protein